MTDPVAEYKAEVDKLKGKRDAAVASLSESLKQLKRQVRVTEQQLRAFTGKKVKGRKPYEMTPEHKEKIRLGKLKSKKAAKRAKG